MERWKLVGARGRHEDLGAFISIGALLLPSEYCPDFFLFLSRRYISDQDPRARMSAKQVMEACRARYGTAGMPEDPQKFLEAMHTTLPAHEPPMV